MKKPYDDISARLKWHRNSLGLTQTEYAQKAGISRARLNNWESGDYRIGLNGALALQKIFGLSLDFIYLGIIDALDVTLRKELRDNPSIESFD